MDQLKFKDLVQLFEELKKRHSVEEILEMAIYIGDDDELNGIHCAWFCEELNNKDEDEDSEYLIKKINSRAGNNKLKDKAILIY